MLVLHWRFHRQTPKARPIYKRARLARHRIIVRYPSYSVLYDFTPFAGHRVTCICRCGASFLPCGNGRCYERVYPMKKRQVSNAPVKKGPLASIESEYLGDFPGLIEHCTAQAYETGEPRRPGWFTVQATYQGWVVVVKDPDSATQLRCEADTLDDSLAMAELMVCDENTGWMPDPWLEKTRGKKK